MFERNTVFIVGAGASAEFGLPVGRTLLETIRDNSHFNFDRGRFPSKGNRKIFDTVFGKYEKDEAKIQEAFTTFIDIHQGVETAGSIDEYINRYSDDSMIAELGKVLIAHAIVEAEGKSKLMPQRANSGDGIDWSNTSATWIASFTRALFDGVRASEIEQIGEGLTIICFNYDRCIEHYLECAIMRAYRDADRKVARKIVSNMKIIHPYGWLGDLNNFTFGTPLENTDLYKVASNLITWSETVEERDKLTSIKAAVLNAENLIFLGFAFANQNMKLLHTGSVAERDRKMNVYATGYGLSNDIEEKLKGKITALFDPNPRNVYQHERIRIKYGVICKDFMENQLLNFTV